MSTKYVVIFALFAFIGHNAYAQEAQLSLDDMAAEWTLNMDEFNTFKHVKLPKKNFIIKKGGIPNYKSLKGLKLKIKSKSNAEDQYYLVRSDGGKFFNKYKTICVDLSEAINSGELIKVTS